jgi:hypothetical protein
MIWHSPSASASMMAGSGDEARPCGRKGLSPGVPAVAGVGSILAYATEDWSLWQRR